ncbi:MAG: hypothetical protein J6Q27_00080 [Clostridia bacterium]|nr:hypothetical protein [Clostridia bacterium]
MKKNWIVLALCLTTLVTCATACKNKNESNVIPLPVATANPNITHPEGRFYVVNKDELMADGGLTVLGEDFLKIMVEGKEIEFALSKKAMDEIAVFNKDKKNPQIMRGTMLEIRYTKQNLVYVAESIGIVNAN